MGLFHFLLAQGLGFAILQLVPRSLNTTTTIVGYPIHANFNIDYYYAVYLIQLCFVAPMSLFLFHRSSQKKDVLVAPIGGVEQVERKLLYYVIVPMLICFVFSRSAVPRSWIHLYHDAESVLSSHLLQKGFFPWRDFVFTHGFLQDPLMALVGHKLFGNTVWGADHGVALLWIPLFHLCWYFLFLKIYSKSQSFLWVLIFVLPFLSPAFFERFNLRFVLFPLILLQSLRFFENPKPWNALILGTVLAFCIFLTPEMILYALCLTLCLAGFDMSRQKTPVSLLWFGGGAGLVGLILGGFLHLNGALGSFLKIYTEEGFHYRYESGIPLTLELGAWFVLALVIPLACFFVGNFYFFRIFRSQNRFTAIDWMLLSYHLFSIFYFSKLLCRADAHVLAHSGIAVPLLLYFVLQFRVFSKSRIRWASLAIFIWGAQALLPHLNPYKFKIDLSTPTSKWSKFGLHKDNKVSDEIISDLDGLFRKLLSPGESVFDFTNEPLLFHYLLDRTPATRFPYVIMAATRETQERLIQDLERSKPKLVVYASQLDYASWDGVPANVRHYEISRYLLKNYKKMHAFKHHLILQRKDLNLKYSEVADSQFKIESCDWGYAPNFLKEFQTAGEVELDFSTQKVNGGYVTQIMLPSSTWDKDSVIEFEFDSAFQDSFSFYGMNEALGIHFKTVGMKDFKVALPLASCSQWWNYQGDSLKLVYHQPQNIKVIRLRSLISKPLVGSFAKLSNF